MVARVPVTGAEETEVSLGHPITKLKNKLRLSSISNLALDTKLNSLE